MVVRDLLSLMLSKKKRLIWTEGVHWSLKKGLTVSAFGGLSFHVLLGPMTSVYQIITFYGFYYIERGGGKITLSILQLQPLQESLG